MAAVAQAAPDVSVVIPAFNVSEHVKDQIDALLAQRTAHRYEIVVADNGSMDGSADIVRALAAEHPVVRLVDASAVRGSSHARNVGVRAARGSVVALCDADDLVAEGWLDAIVGAVRPDVIATGPLLVDWINDPHVAGWRPPRGDSALNPAFGFLPFAPSGNMAIGREDFLRLGGFREDYPKSHDVEFSWRAQLAGMVLVHVDNAKLHYRYRSTMTGVLRQAIRSGRASAQLYADFGTHGLRRPDAREVGGHWTWLVTRAPFLLSQRRRGVWMRRFGEAIGRIAGSVRFRVWYL